MAFVAFCYCSGWGRSGGVGKKTPFEKWVDYQSRRESALAGKGLGQGPRESFDHHQIYARGSMAGGIALQPTAPFSPYLADNRASLSHGGSSRNSLRSSQSGFGSSPIRGSVSSPGANRASISSWQGAPRAAPRPTHSTRI